MMQIKCHKGAGTKMYKCLVWYIIKYNLVTDINYDTLEIFFILLFIR